MPLPISVVEHREPFTQEWLEALSERRIIACDFPVAGAADATSVTGGFEIGRIINVDHHADIPSMKQLISSANLALERVRASGLDPLESEVIISHADCDSVLSAGIMSGRLLPHSVLGESALAADHTGAPDLISDVLQELENIRDAAKATANDKASDLAYCFDVVNKIIEAGERHLDSRARSALANRRRKREAAAIFAGSDQMQFSDGLAFGCPGEKLDGEFFPALIPSAAAILLMTRRHDDPQRWDAKIRLGLSAPKGLDLLGIGIRELDPEFGGRWNAGSNSRNGGTTLTPDVYARNFSARLRRAMKAIRQN